MLGYSVHNRHPMSLLLVNQCFGQWPDQLSISKYYCCSMEILVSIIMTLIWYTFDIEIVEGANAEAIAIACIINGWQLQGNCHLVVMQA